MFSRQTLIVIFIFVFASTGASDVFNYCKRVSSSGTVCICEPGFTNLDNKKCLNQWLVIGILIGVVLLLIITVIILGCCLSNAKKAKKQPVPVEDCVLKEQRSTSTSSLPKNETKDASTVTEREEAPIRAKVPMFGAPFSYTNSSFENNEMNYIPDFMRRKNYDQVSRNNTFEEIPLHDGRRVGRPIGEDPKTIVRPQQATTTNDNQIFSIKRPVNSFYSKATDKAF